MDEATRSLLYPLRDAVQVIGLLAGGGYAVARFRRARWRLRAAKPENPPLCIFTADVFAGEGNDPRRAAALFQKAREMDAVTADQDLYATRRLADLYRGPLNDPHGAAKELRRLIDRHPGTREARDAEQAIRSLSETR